MTDWQLVKCELLRSGKVLYTFRYRAQTATPSGRYTASVEDSIELDHPRDDWQIAKWYDLEEVTK